MKYIIILFALFLFLNSSAQTVKFPSEKQGSYKTYISKDSIIFEVGQTITIGLPFAGNNFTFITQGNAPVVASLSGNNVEIVKLKSIGNKKTGYKVYAYFKGYGLIPVIIDIEQAIKTGEIEL